MGGIGSGTWMRTNKKPTNQNYWRFSMVALKQHGVIDNNVKSSGEWAWWRDGHKRNSVGYEVDTSGTMAWIRVQYQNKQTGVAYDYKIYLTSTVPNYGGKRWWFVCPIQGCGKRVSVLYMGRIFACRHCCNLAYSTQNETPPFRNLYKAQKIHQDLGGDGSSPGENIPPKPKGMKRKTYRRNVKKMTDAYIDATNGIMAFATKQEERDTIASIIG